MMKFTKSLELQPKFHKIVPGACHTYAKGDDQFPEFMPPYIVKGKGVHLWDLDGNKFIEYGNGIRSVTLGHAFEPVVQAVQKQIMLGNNFVRPAVIEYQCAEEFLSVINRADMVKFCKDGSDATGAALRLARAHTGRDYIAVCGSQPFFSHDDWFIGSTPMNSGVPKAVQDLTLKFNYNDIDSVKQLFEQYPNQIAAIILEAEKYSPPKNNFLHEVRNLCRENGTVFILDEMITGFRWDLGGAQRYYDLDPDLSTWGKALGNGFSIAALAGKAELMNLGGLNHDKKRVWLLSATHSAECPSLAACMATIKFYKENNVVEQLHKQGHKLKKGVMKSVKEHGLEKYFGAIGRDCSAVYFTRDQQENPSQPFRTLFFQEMIKRGVLIPSLIVTYSHTDEIIEETLEKLHESLLVYKKAINEGVEKYLIGRSVKPVFRVYN
jgi:glutamate-1-semialdehyde 2,1-aminomutase